MKQKVLGFYKFSVTVFNMSFGVNNFNSFTNGYNPQQGFMPRPSGANFLDPPQMTQPTMMNQNMFGQQMGGQQMQNMQQQNPMMSQQMTVPNFECSTVFSETDARNSAISTDGSPKYMVLSDGSTIFKKQFNVATGGFNFDTFSKVEPVQNPVENVENTSEFHGVSKEDLDELRVEFATLLTHTQDSLLNNIIELFGGGNNEHGNESNAVNANDVQPTASHTTNGTKQPHDSTSFKQPRPNGNVKSNGTGQSNGSTNATKSTG